MTAGDDNRKTCETIDGAEWVFITAKKISVPFFLCFVCLDFFYIQNHCENHDFCKILQSKQ